MSALLSYSPADLVPLGHATYLQLFAHYNGAFWPVVIIAAIAGAGLLWLLRRPSAAALRTALLVLAAAWLWIAWAFFWKSYRPLNWSMSYAALGFAAQGALLLAIASASAFSARVLQPSRQPFALALLAGAIIGLPLIGLALHQDWTGLEYVGAAPDPTVLATMAVALFLRTPLRITVLVVPVAWALFSGMTLWVLGDPRWTLLPLAALASGLYAMLRPDA